MAINPMMLMQLKSKLDGFNARHPKLKRFFGDVFSKLEAGDVLEISVTKANGNKIKTNFRVSEEDRQMLSELSSMIGHK